MEKWIQKKNNSKNLSNNLKIQKANIINLNKIAMQKIKKLKVYKVNLQKNKNRLHN